MEQKACVLEHLREHNWINDERPIDRGFDKMHIEPRSRLVHTDRRQQPCFFGSSTWNGGTFLITLEVQWRPRYTDWTIKERLFQSLVFDLEWWVQISDWDYYGKYLFQYHTGNNSPIKRFPSCG